MRYNEFNANRFLQNRLPERRIFNPDFIWNTTATRTDISNAGYNPYDNQFRIANPEQLLLLQMAYVGELGI